jgi:hypothetical protein
LFPGKILPVHSRYRTSGLKESSGFGNGLVQSAAFVALTASIPTDHMAMVCSSFYLSANTGTVVGLATTNAVLQGVLRNGLEFALRDEPNKDLVS